MTDSRLIFFHVGNWSFAVPLNEVREIVAAASVTPVPGARPPLEGVMVYRREEALPLFSLPSALGIDYETVGGFVAVSEIDGVFLGFRVEGIGGVIDGVEGNHLDKYHGELKGRPGAIKGAFEFGDRFLVVLNLSEVFQKVVC